MGQAFGSIANSIGSGGSALGGVGANLLNKNVTDPRQAKWGDLDASEKGARLIAGTTKGLASGFQNYRGQGQMGGGGVGPMPEAQPVDPAYFQPQSANDRLIKRAGGMSGNNLSFYGDSNG